MKGLVALTLVLIFLAACGGPATPIATPCNVPPARTNAVEDGVNAGAVIIYERIGEGTCTSESWTFYPDGRIVGDNGKTTVDEQVTATEISTLVNDINELGFYELESTTHTACKACYTYFITVNDSEVKTVSAVDGGTDVRGEYWQVFAKIKAMISDFPTD